MTEKERAKQLAEEHWKYVGALLQTHGVGEEELAIIAFHYKSAAVHFHLHGAEDERNGMFRPKIGEPLTIGEIAAIARPCSNCYDEKECGGGLRLASGDCLHYRPKVSDQQHPAGAI